MCGAPGALHRGVGMSPNRPKRRVQGVDQECKSLQKNRLRRATSGESHKNDKISEFPQKRLTGCGPRVQIVPNEGCTGCRPGPRQGVCLGSADSQNLSGGVRWPAPLCTPAGGVPGVKSSVCVEGAGSTPGARQSTPVHPSFGTIWTPLPTPLCTCKVPGVPHKDACSKAVTSE